MGCTRQWGRRLSRIWQGRGTGGGQFPPFGAPVPSADELPSLPGTGLWGLKVEAKAASSMLKLPTSHHVSTLRTSEVECG